MQSKLAGWKSKTLSQSGKSTLIRSITTSLPQYSMQSILLPIGWCRTVDRCLKDFWWDFPTGKTRNYTSKAWGDICQPKQFGGLGIRRLEEMNRAFILKLAWSLFQKPNSVNALIMKAKYHPRTSLLEAGAKSGASIIWQGISRVLGSLKGNVCIVPCNGAAVSIVDDPWMPSLPAFKPSRLLTSSTVHWVAELVDHSTSGWDLSLIQSLFTADSIPYILALSLPNQYHVDSLFGVPILVVFSLRRARQCFLSEHDWSLLWKLPLQDQLKLLFWKVASEAIPVRAPSRIAFGSTSPPICANCGDAQDSILHIFHGCVAT